MTELRQRLASLFELNEGTPEISHFWLKFFGVCAFLAVEAYLITMVFYGLSARLNPGGENISFSWGCLLSIGIAIALDLAILKIYK